MKVYLINEHDFVCAETEEIAKEFYVKALGFDEIEIFGGEVGVQEVDLKETLLVEDEKGNIVRRSFKEVIKQLNITEPSLISFTEE